MDFGQKRIVLYSQHISGVGHHFRNREIIRALSLVHEVYFVDGGREILGADLPESVKIIRLPPIFRDPETGCLTSKNLTKDISEVLSNRARILKDAISRIQPDAFIIEFFPFAREEFTNELIASIQKVRAQNPEVKVLCSLRDIPRRSTSVDHSKYPPPSPSGPDFESELKYYLNSVSDKTERNRRLKTFDYYKFVNDILNKHFDCLLIHADKKITVLEDHYHWADHISIPIVYTGYISEKPSSSKNVVRYKSNSVENHCVLVSTGGGSEGYELAMPCVQAWKQLYQKGATGERKMVIFLGTFSDQAQYQVLEKACSGGPFVLGKFVPNFLQWMQAADFSISYAGYNTCMNILETQTPALLVPNRSAGDQKFRALRLAELGLVERMNLGNATSERIAMAIQRGFTQVPISHDISLDGAERTCQFVTQIMSNESDDVMCDFK
ncbi:MAG: hypothetical protein F4W91_14520 [Gemmatimonadetes bacterium]|nr:hypothetical protein [Gemmatimonadota bacterium]